MQDPTLNRGQCKAGQQLCSRGRWGLCEGAVTPQLEICGNGIDENCDGFDEDCPSECSPPGQKQDCYSGPPETRDIGECRAGTRICGANGKWGPCEGEVTPQPEICFDGKDNDCNSKIDDGCASECKEGETKPCYSGPPETKDVGACKAGTQTCEHGKWGKCSGEILPKREICGNNIDDDCNGKIDDCEPTQLLSGSWDTLSPLLSWDLKTAQVTQYYQQGHTDAVSAVAYSPDGKSILSAGHDKQLIAWDANTAKILWQRTEHTDAIYSIAVDPNGQFVATGSGDQTIRLWNPSDGKVKHTLPNNTGGVYSMAIAPSGKLLAAGCGDGVLRIWDLSQSPKIAHSLTGHGLSIFAVAVNRNGTLIASGSRDGSIRLWQTNGSPGPQIADLSVSITALTFANQNPWLAIATSDGEIQLWDLSSASPQKLHTLTDKDSGQAYTLLFHPLDSNLVSGHYNNGILFWDTKTNKLIQSLHGHKAPISSLAFRP
jgi:WD40 repeat protein